MKPTKIPSGDHFSAKGGSARKPQAIDKFHTPRSQAPLKGAKNVNLGSKGQTAPKVFGAKPGLHDIPYKHPKNVKRTGVVD